MDAKIIICQEMFVNMKRCYYIKSIDNDRLKNFAANLSDSEISSDYDKYAEKAKIIMQESLKEKTYTYDKDDLILSSIFLLGASCLMSGSIMFSEPIQILTLGSWVFRLGSFFYLFGSLICLFSFKKLENEKFLKKYIDLIIIIINICGSVSFISGGIIFQLGYINGAILWICGSSFFSLASVLMFYNIIIK